MLVEIVLPDLQGSTAKGFWMLGRRLYLRIHLGIFVLQALLKKTDRGIIEAIRDARVFQAFCGRTLIENWSCPHPTKVEEFRSRLSPETKIRINEAIVLLAVQEVFASSADIDKDSTVQEANISYPTDAGMLLKLAKKCFRLIAALQSDLTVNLEKLTNLVVFSIFFDLKVILLWSCLPQYACPDKKAIEPAIEKNKAIWNRFT